MQIKSENVAKNCPTTALRLLENCQMAARRLPDNFLTKARWFLHNVSSQRLTGSFWRLEPVEFAVHKGRISCWEMSACPWQKWDILSQPLNALPILPLFYVQTSFNSYFKGQTWSWWNEFKWMELTLKIEKLKWLLKCLYMKCQSLFLFWLLTEQYGACLTQPISYQDTEVHIVLYVFLVITLMMG